MQHTSGDLPSMRTLLLERERCWLRIWLNRPERRNALSREMTDELSAALDLALGDPDVRGIVVRGKGGVFCAGGDLKSFNAAGGADDRAAVVADSRAGGVLFNRINQYPKPVIMLVEGAAIAGGLGLACTGDLVIATADARFSLTETMLGLVPAQIAPFVIGRVGLSRARQLTLTAARFDGRAAEKFGLVHKVADDGPHLEALARAALKDMERCAPDANAATKALLLAAPGLPPERMTDVAAETFADALLGEEGREGVAAFVDKRSPRWAVMDGDETL